MIENINLYDWLIASSFVLGIMIIVIISPTFKLMFFKIGIKSYLNQISVLSFMNKNINIKYICYSDITFSVSGRKNINTTEKRTTIPIYTLDKVYVLQYSSGRLISEDITIGIFNMKNSSIDNTNYIDIGNFDCLIHYYLKTSLIKKIEKMDDVEIDIDDIDVIIDNGYKEYRREKLLESIL